MLAVLPGCELLRLDSDSDGLKDVLPVAMSKSIGDTGWNDIGSGFQLRELNIQNEIGVNKDLVLVKVPEHARVEVHQAVDAPKNVGLWRRHLNAAAVINGGFFDEHYAATGLLLENDEQSGAAVYDGSNGYTGMLVVKDGQTGLMYLPDNPINAEDVPTFDYALQSFPTLIKPGREPGVEEDSGRYARRTAIAQLNTGEIVFVVTRKSEYSLFELMNTLMAHIPDIDMALNLDGGPSTGLSLAVDSTGIDIPSSTVPNVIAVFAE